jgi:hypothetical protein
MTTVNIASTPHDTSPATEIDTVHVIFKTHLDIGFTDFARNVVQQYHTGFIPQALATAQALRERGGAERMIWTTGSWLIYEHLEQANDEERARMEAAIATGDIVWHGLPFTTHSEAMDPSLFRFGLSLAADLDRRFGRSTIAGKMTDVPGHTRGIVPLLAEAGIEFLHIGVNPGSETPDVPPVFVWRAGGADVVVMYERGSYGDLKVIPGMRDALYFAHTGDNLGPQTPEQVIDVFGTLRTRFPDATVVASTLDAFAHKLLAIKDTLPVVHDEIGDTWIHGIASDPLRISQFRELQRLRNRWLAEGASSDDPALHAFSRFLIMVPEHTWGLDEKVFLGDVETYAVPEFQAVRGDGKWREMEESWLEQRGYIRSALDALGTSDYAKEAREALAALAPERPSTDGFERTEAGTSFDTTHWTISFDGRGAISRLVEKHTGRQWADAAHPLALFGYQIFGADDYDRFLDQYIINKDATAWWTPHDFGKPGMGGAAPTGRAFEPHLRALHHRYHDEAHHVIVEIGMPEEANIAYGAPRELFLEVRAPDDAPTLELTLQWFGKPACRIAEALWLHFVPITTDEYGWRFLKMGIDIEPHEVVRNGNRKLHGVEDGVRYQDDKGMFTLRTLDAPLVAPGEPSLLDFNNDQPAMANGVHVNLFNNVWGTNFRMWYDDDTRFRFVVSTNDQRPTTNGA